MKILILGCNGQLGRCLKDQLVTSDHEVIFTSRDQIDITDINATKKSILDIKPNLVLNASAYTAVDNAEEDKESANLVNHIAVTGLANICLEVDCWLFHVSTDYVFDGTSLNPYKENDQANPQGVYGLSKLMGEKSLHSSGCKYLIFRIAWVFSEYGNNFLKTMLNLGMVHEELKIVDDQIGCPTDAQEIASAMVRVIPCIEKEQLTSGIYNFCSDIPCSWYEFAKEIFKVADELGLPTPNKIHPISSSEFPTKAKRPKYSVLDCSKIYDKFKIEPPSWKKSLIPIINKLYIK